MMKTKGRGRKGGERKVHQARRRQATDGAAAEAQSSGRHDEATARLTRDATHTHVRSARLPARRERRRIIRGVLGYCRRAKGTNIRDCY